MTRNQASSNIYAAFIAGYALILGAGHYSIYTISAFFALTLIYVLINHKTICLKNDTILYLIFTVYAVLSTLYANYKWGALVFSTSILSGSLFYTVLRNSEEWKEKILYTLIICGIVNGIFGIYQTIDQTMVSGLFYDKNAFSGFLTPLIPLSIYLQLKKNKKYLTAATAFLIFSNLLSHSKAGIYTTILALFIIAFHLWKNKDREKIRILGLSVIFGFYSYFIFSYIIPDASPWTNRGRDRNINCKIMHIQKGNYVLPFCTDFWSRYIFISRNISDIYQSIDYV